MDVDEKACQDWLNKFPKEDILPDPEPEQAVMAVDVSSGDLLAVTHAARIALKIYNNLGNVPKIFRRGGRYARVLEGINGEHYIQVLDTPALFMNAILPAALWKKMDPKTRGHASPVFYNTHPPEILVKNLLAEADLKGICPEIRGVVDIPPIDVFGNIMDKKGFDEETGILYTGQNHIDVPNDPTEQDIKEAGDLLSEVFIDFPTKIGDNASKHNMIAALITAVLRPHFANPPPMFVINKNMIGIGGSKLSKVIAVVITGCMHPKMIGWNNNDDENRKAITTEMLKANPVIIWDNVASDTPIDSANLARLITSNMWGDRQLQSNTEVSVPNKSICILNGNNIKFTSDLHRRAVFIRLTTDNPNYIKEAVAFKHDPIEQWVLLERTNLVRAVYILYTAWLRAGKPEPKAKMASFEEWVHVVGGMLSIIKMDDFLKNTDDANSDAGMDELTRFTDWINAQKETYKEGFTASELLRVYEMENGNRNIKDPLVDSLPDSVLGLKGAALSTGLGKWFGKVRDKPGANGFKVVKSDKHPKNKSVWQVVPNKTKETKQNEIS